MLGGARRELFLSFLHFTGMDTFPIFPLSGVLSFGIMLGKRTLLVGLGLKALFGLLSFPLQVIFSFP
jgi:hypothetical protein